jgi:hypothetical protein
VRGGDTLFAMVGGQAGRHAPFHAELVLSATRSYEAHLQAMPESRIEGHPANLIHRTVQAALLRGISLRTNEVMFSARTFEGIGIPERRKLLNQFTLGLGRDDAEVVAMGTEPAFSLVDPISLCTENIGNHVVWLTHGNPTILGTLTNDTVRNADDRRFHIHPNDHYRKGRGHTWGRLARVLGTGEEHEPDAEPGLGSAIRLTRVPCPHRMPPLGCRQPRSACASWFQVFSQHWLRQRACS